MTRVTNARVAGATLLLYIVVGVSEMVFLGGTTAGDGTAARLATMAQRAGDVRLNIVLGLLTCVFALTLGVTLYAITRDEDQDVALLGLLCRVGEGVIGGAFMPLTLGLLAVATGAASGPAADPPHGVVTLVTAARGWNVVVCATFFSIGSLLFCWLLLRGRMIPVTLAWLGVVASVVLVVGLPLQILGLIGAPVTLFMWLPMALFEIPLGVWFLVKGVNPVRSLASR